METINPTLLEDNSNLSAFFCADVVGGRRFAQNFGGYPRSEIAELNEAATAEMQMNILQNLQDFTPSSNPNAGLSDAEIMLSHKSKYQQAASEVIDWIDGQLHQKYLKAQAEQMALEKRSNVDVKSDQDIIDNA